MTRKTTLGIGVAIIIVLIIAMVLHFPRSVAEVTPALPDQNRESVVTSKMDSKTPGEPMVGGPGLPDDSRGGNSNRPGFNIQNRRPNPHVLSTVPSDEDNAREAKEMNDPGMGSLPGEVIREAIDEIKPFIKECYEKTRVDFPDASGKILLEFVLEAEDSVIRPSRARILESGTTLTDEQMTECVVKAIGDLEIKGPTDAVGTVKVRYPFVFSTASSKEVE